MEMNRPAPIAAITRDLLRAYEQRHDRTLSPDDMVATFGEDCARTLSDLLAGRWPEATTDVVQAVESLEGSDEDIATVLKLDSDADAILNDRLRRHGEEMEAFLRETNQFEAFCEWKKKG